MTTNKQTIMILSGGFIKDKRGAWHSSSFRGPVFGSHLRILAGGYLFKNNPNLLIIVTGDRGYFKNIKGMPRLAEIMKQELAMLGVAKEKIITEKKSNNTYQQIQTLKTFLKKPGIDDISVISNKYHMGRIRTFIKKDPILERYFSNGKIKLLTAESIVTKYNPRLKNKIKNLYGSKKMKNLIEKERNGVKQILDGSYNIGQNTSRSNQYI